MPHDLPKRYLLTDEQLKKIRPSLRKLEGADLLLTSLSNIMGEEKRLLWDTIYKIYPELRNKPVRINEDKKEVIIVEQPRIVKP